MRSRLRVCVRLRFVAVGLFGSLCVCVRLPRCLPDWLLFGNLFFCLCSCVPLCVALICFLVCLCVCVRVCLRVSSFGGSHVLSSTCLFVRFCCFCLSVCLNECCSMVCLCAC